MYAYNSTTVTSFQFAYTSGPIHSKAYLFVWSTMYWRMSIVKNRLKMSRGVAGIATVGPTVCVKTLGLIGLTVLVHFILIRKYLSLLVQYIIYCTYCIFLFPIQSLPLSSSSSPSYHSLHPHCSLHLFCQC